LNIITTITIYDFPAVSDDDDDDEGSDDNNLKTKYIIL